MSRSDWINLIGAGIPMLLVTIWVLLMVFDAIGAVGNWLHNVAHPTITVEAPQSESEAFPVIEGAAIRGTPVYSEEAAGWVTAEQQRKLERRARAPKEI